MADPKPRMELANLICKFGDQHVLVDYLNEIVFPAFFDTSLTRKYGQSKYFFDEVKLVDLTDDNADEKVIGISGRIIKDTMLYRDQIFESGEGLVRDRDSLRSCPSAIFLLIVNNHRLIYVKETRYAPSKEQFKSALLVFLKRKRIVYVNEQLEKEIGNSDITQKRRNEIKQEIGLKIGIPKIELVRLTSMEGIENFVKKFEILKTLEIILKDRNDENDNDEFFEDLQNRKDAIKSKRTSIRHTNKNGLSKNDATKEIADATAQGNQEVRVSGVDKAGDTISGNNEKFQIRKTLSSLSKVPATAAKKLYKSFNELIADGTIQVPATPDKARNAIENIDERITR